MKNNKLMYLLVLLAVLILTGGTYGIANYVENVQEQKRIEQKNKENNGNVADDGNDSDLLDGLQKVKINHEQYGYKKSIRTYLVMGTDHSGSEDKTGDEYEGSMADFLLLIVVDEENESYGMLQIDRDTMTEVPLMNPDGTSYATSQMQLCTAHYFGGDKKQSCKNTVKTVSKLFGGIEIDGYYAISMDQIPEINHAVGGVKVEIKDDFSKVDKTMKKGKTILLNDEQAGYYVQGRMDVGDGENSSRMARQREYLSALMDVINKKSKKDNRFLKKILNQLKRYATTNISIGAIYNQYKKASGYDSIGILLPEGKKKTGQALDDGIEHTEFYMDKNSKYDIINKLYRLETIKQK